MITIIGARLNNRVNTSQNLQKILTEHGCSIKTRIGIHEVENGACSPNGIILLEVINEDKAKSLINDLKTIEHIEIQSMTF